LTRSHKRLWILALFALTAWARPARASDPPADLCMLLPAADVSKSLGRTYDEPKKSVAPRPFANTAEGTDCNYPAPGSKLWFRAYVDSSPAQSTELFAKLGMFYSPQTKVEGLGDEAYFDPQHALHVRKGKVRFYLNLDPLNSPATVEKQLKDLASKVIARL
jgi:hypothetical protein